jgi:predicted protein tyrosine phosphatase
MIHVCPLSRLHETVLNTGALHIVTMLRDPNRMQRPRHVPPSNHLVLSMDDISQPMDGYVPPSEEHILKLLDFLKLWDRSRPLVVHCLAGISRSTAGAFVAACALNPQRSEAAIARAIREASPTAVPNRMFVKLADEVLGRKGRMVAAIEAIGAGQAALEADPFHITLE